MLGDDRSLAVERIAERVEHAADHSLADRHAEQFAGAPHLVALHHFQVVAEDDHADGVFLEIECQSRDAAGEFDHFTGHHAGEAPHARDAVADLEHATDLANVDARLEPVDLLTQYRGDLVRIEFHECSSASAVP